MELNENNLSTLARYLEQTLSPDINIRRPAEKFLESLESNKNYPVLLLTLVEKADLNPTIRITGSITFKNFVKRNWKMEEDGVNRIHPEDRATIKSQIVGLMLHSPDQIQRQLSDAISIVGKEDFPDSWPNLLPEMVTRFQSGDFNVINGVLRTAHSLFKRYRYELKSQLLWTEVKYVLDNFAKPLTDLFVATLELADTHAANQEALKVIFGSLILISKIFYSLNTQDLPEFFEDNMATWMRNFLKLLTMDNPLLKSEAGDSEPGLLDKLKSQICNNAMLYAQVYDEEFKPYISEFVTAVWNLLTTTDQQVKYDLLVSSAIHFLSTVANRPPNKHLFENDSILSSICEKIIIPNMEFRTSDEELFEENPEEYIRRDIEGSDVDTRRRAACDFVKVLSTYFESQIMEVFSRYVGAMLERYSKSPESHWKSKDAAVYLVTSMAVRGKTEKHGITQTSALVNLSDFYRDYIFPDLDNANINQYPVLKADALKYLMIFRNQLPLEVVAGSLPKVMRMLLATSTVVHTYSACCLEKAFAMRDGTSGLPSISATQVQPMSQNLLNALFDALDLPGSQENEYVMKAIMRTISLLGDLALPFLPSAVMRLTDKLTAISKNPSKPHFNHYLFESLSLCVRIICKSNLQAVGTFEEALFPVFQEILQQDVQEFIPYVFQILSLLLELHQTPVPGPYMALFPCLLAPVLWDRPGTISPLVRLLQAYIHKGADQVVASEKLPGVLGVFQKLIASKLNDHEGFYILQSLVEHVNPNAMEPYLKHIFVILFSRLQGSKTTKYVKSLVIFFCLFVHRYGAETLVKMIDSIQAKMFGMVLERLLITDVQKISGSIEKKICAVGITKLLTEALSVVDGEYVSLWVPLLQALIGLFELPEDESVPEDEHFIEIEDTPGYQSAYCKLVHAGKKPDDPFLGRIPDAKIFLAQSLGKLSTSFPGKLKPMIQSGLAPVAAQHLQTYLQAANVTIH